MREGKGKWVESDKTNYEGTYFYMIVQVHLKLTSSMDSANKSHQQVRYSKENLRKGIEKLIKIQIKKNNYNIFKNEISLKNNDKFISFVY